METLGSTLVKIKEEVFDDISTTESAQNLGNVKSEVFDAFPASDLSVTNCDNGTASNGELTVKEECFEIEFKSEDVESNFSDKNDSNGQGFVCEQCCKNFPSKLELETHIQTIHIQNQAVASSSKTNTGPSLLNYLNNLNLKRLFKCNVCKRGFGSKFQVIAHEETHKKKKTLPCDTCGKLFSGPYFLTIHIRRYHTAERPFECAECKMRFKTKSELRHHIPSHNGEKSHACEYCGNYFKTRAQRVVHVRRRHTGENPFSCDQCGMRFPVKDQIVKHSWTHIVEKLYPCEQCGKSYKVPQHLEIHIRRCHSDDKPYVCEFCGKRFGVKFALVAHLICHSKERPFGCDKCEKRYKTKHHLKTHIRISHKEVQSTSKP